jgi:hypothetical protein
MDWLMDHEWGLSGSHGWRMDMRCYNGLDKGEI